MKKIFFLLYLLLLAFHLIAGEQGWDDAVFYSKPLLLISLILIFLPYPLKKGFNQFSIFIMLGLIFSLGGDTLLMFQDQGGFFVYGLSSFLLAHIFYILAFFRTNRKNHEIPLIKRQGWVMVLIVAYGFLFFPGDQEVSSLDTLRVSVLINNKPQTIKLRLHEKI